MRNQSFYLFISFVFALVSTACGPDLRDRENYGDLSSPPGAILLNDQNKHSAGWGRSDCLLCHNASLNIHQRPGSGIDINALNQAIINGGESVYCLKCHGTNGLTP
jgi:hypothetical protein